MKHNHARFAAMAAGIAVIATAFAGTPAMAAAPAENAPPPMSPDSCAALVGTTISASTIDLPTTGATVKTATWAVETGGGQCRVVGDIHPVDPTAPAMSSRSTFPRTGTSALCSSAAAGTTAHW